MLPMPTYTTVAVVLAMSPIYTTLTTGMSLTTTHITRRITRRTFPPLELMVDMGR